ncbi:MAG: hypothetical protein KAS16_06210, partial [Thermoplasmata archaeon]|nr:hypothetical protein [Thermoplasmata archaeon]
INLTTTDGSSFVCNGDNYACSGQSDITPPEVSGIKATSLTHVELTFNEPVNQTDAENITNYMIDGGIGPNPSSAVLSPDQRTVELTTGLQTAGQMYNITISNINDGTSPPNTIQAGTVASFTGGQQTLEILDVVQDLGNKSIAYLTTDAQSQADYTLYAFNISDIAEPPNNQPESSIDFSGGGVVDTFDIPILPTPGWNFVSFSLDVAGSVLDILDDSAGDGATTWDHLYWYDGGDAVNHWKSYNKNYAGTQTLAFINNTMGLWIRITDVGDGFLTIEGIEPNSTSIDLKAGWNLVGYPSLVGKPISDALDGTGYSRVEGFNATAPYCMEELADSYVMTAGEGYWVHVPADAVWVVDW